MFERLLRELIIAYVNNIDDPTGCSNARGPFCRRPLSTSVSRNRKEINSQNLEKIHSPLEKFESLVTRMGHSSSKVHSRIFLDCDNCLHRAVPPCTSFEHRSSRVTNFTRTKFVDSSNTVDHNNPHGQRCSSLCTCSRRYARKITLYQVLLSA